MSLEPASWEDPAGPTALSLADELERMLDHTSALAEEDASTGDLLEDLEARLEGIVRRLRGQVMPADMMPHRYFYPMSEEQ